MGRKKQNPEDSIKRGLILKKAAKMFMTQGYSAVSMDGLAEAVPVSKRTLYNHFKDKKALFTAVMQNRCQLLFSTLEQSLDGSQNVEKTLTEIAKEFLGVVLEPDALNIYRTAITESQHFPELGKLFYESGPKRSRAILAEYLSKVDASGEMKVPNPELAAGIFLNMLLGRIQMQCLLGLKKDVSPAEKNEIIRYVVTVFLYGHSVKAKKDR
jgi:TetR/AcrR family transcriptional repressor of mexJK operon